MKRQINKQKLSDVLRNEIKATTPDCSEGLCSTSSSDLNSSAVETNCDNENDDDCRVSFIKATDLPNLLFPVKSVMNDENGCCSEVGKGGAGNVCGDPIWSSCHCGLQAEGVVAFCIK